MTEERIIAYLLGELPEKEAERFEDECFTGESWPAELNLVEEDLIDDYLCGALAPERRMRFEDNYLTTDARVERVRMAVALLRHVDGHTAADVIPDVTPDVTPAVLPAKAKKTSGTWLDSLWGGRLFAPRAAFAVILFVVVIGGAYWALFKPSSDQTVVMVALAPSAADRSAGVEPTKVKLPTGAGALKISMTLPEESAPSARYRVEFEDGKGRIESRDAAGQDARSVSVVIPAERLARGTYAIRLFAVTAQGSEQRIKGSYLFSVE